ncbi:phospholipid phosphatase 1-like [Gigantopelta aegis]|uniref:phospholipid phosphatase 1-like n=1 Tax=Gigantopelta aegis TaxID=1735272 RepID=UPI001B88C036|nr:phospholipid phosphatase 1-like [Gigantopelta aegis]
MAGSNIKCVICVAGDILFAIVAWVISIVIRRLAIPYHRGFFCDDESLMYPFKNSTIPATVMYSIGFILPCFCIIVTELVIILSSPKAKKRRSVIETLFKVVFKTLVAFFFGGGVTNLITNIAKYSVGRLRPHFFAICRPDWNLANCSTGAIARYVTEDVCTGTDKSLITEARVSFLSGHASMSMYFMVFLLIYIQRRFTWKGVLLLKPALQTLFFSLALYTGLSRISDYKHHWTDVLAGDLLGAVMAILIVLKVSGLYAESRCSSEVELKKCGIADLDKSKECGIQQIIPARDEVDEMTAM